MRTRHAAGLSPLLLLACLGAPHAAQAVERLGKTVVPTFQAVDLDLDADSKYYTGNTVISLKVQQATQSFGFHAEEMRLDSLRLRGPDGPVQTRFTAGGERGLVTVHAATELTPGDYTLQIDFSNDFGTRAVGLYRTVVEEQGYTFTQFEPDDAREAFPCWDEPEFKIPWQLTLRVPEDHTAVTNTPLQSEKPENGRRKMVFAPSRPLPTYLIAIATGPLEGTDIPGMKVPGKVYTVRGQSHLTQEAVKMTPPLLAALERYFDRQYPYEKLDLIAVPEFWPGAMENAGAITFADRILLMDPNQAGPDQRSDMALVIAHELAHMWYGDLVTMRWWDDLWLNEAFADWMSNQIAQEVYPEFQYDVTSIQGVYALMETDARPSTPAIRQNVTGTENLLQEVGMAYNKGRSVLGMFEGWMGAEKFRQGVRSYMKKHEWGSTVAADLWNALSEAAGKDVGTPMATFLVQNGVPLVTLELKEGQVILKQQRYLNHGIQSDPRLWQIPIGLKYFDGKEVRVQQVLLTQAEQSFPLQADGPVTWIFPKAQQRGYYHWNVPPDLLLEIARQAPKVLDVPERIGFLGNLSALLSAGILRGDDYLKVLQPFAEDGDPLVISAVATGIGRVKTPFVPEELEAPFSIYIQRTLRPALDRIGLEPKAGEKPSITLLRPQLMRWLGVEGRDEAVLAHAQELTKAYLEDSTRVPPELAEVALSLSARRGNKTFFDETRQRFEKSQLPAERRLALQTLGAFRDPALMTAALDYALSGPLRPNEILQIPMEMGDTEAHQDQTFQWLLKNFEVIVERLPPMTVSFLPFSAGGCSAERVKTAQAFFADPKHLKPGMESSMAKVTEQVQDCVNLRQREAKNAAAYLLEQTKPN